MTEASRRLAPVVRLAPAKINLTLAVLSRRPDGFHDLHSVVAPLALADRLSVAVRASGPDSVAVTGFDAGPMADNLVVRAIAATREAVRGAWPGAPSLPPSLAARRAACPDRGLAGVRRAAVPCRRDGPHRGARRARHATPRRSR